MIMMIMSASCLWSYSVSVSGKRRKRKPLDDGKPWRLPITYDVQLLQRTQVSRHDESEDD